SRIVHRGGHPIHHYVLTHGVIMAKDSTARKLPEVLPLEVARRPAFGGGNPPPPPVRPNAPIGSNAWLGVLVFLGAEAMFFAGLIGAFLVFRIGSEIWPPPFQPRLPLGITGVNTMILLASAVTMRWAVVGMRRGEVSSSISRLAATAALGALFLLIQGYEWLQLIHFGLTVSSSVYGGLFYTIIGFHALHVLGALFWLALVWAQARRGKFDKQNYDGLQVCGMYWTFVVALWPLLYGLVYLY
ncbi:MAG TPA: heme-copper oxidase subunit III, partial [Candidatus Limnocylindria bacterium]|nr:heme-copper oxidase subunit III [Candidatus Limnocylindria bacterium]